MHMKNKGKLSALLTILAIVSLLSPTGIWASVFVDGLYYELNTSDKTAEVAPNPDKYQYDVVIPESFEYEGVTYSVIQIGSRAFLDCSELTEIFIPSSVAIIESSAFERCKGLTKLAIGKGVHTINYEAFKNCSNLTTLILPASLKKLGNETFAGCSSLKTIVEQRTTAPKVVSTTFDGVDKDACTLYVPEGCKSAYTKASYWKEFTNVVERAVVDAGSCGDDITYIIDKDMTMVISGTGAMWDYNWERWVGEYQEDIRTLVVEDGVTSIGSFAFYRFYGLSSVTIPNSVTHIGYNALAETAWFYDQPEGLLYAGKVAYRYKGGMPEGTEIVLEDGTLGISPGVFEDYKPASLSIPSSVIDIQPVFDYDERFYEGYASKSALESVGSITIDENNPAFDSRDDCNAVIETATNRLIVGSRNTTIPEGVTAIGNYTLGQLTSVEIPSSVVLVENLAFFEGYYRIDADPVREYSYVFRTSVESIKMAGSTPPEMLITWNYPEDSRTYREFLENCILYVPEGSKSAYESAEGWKEFANIVEYDPNQGATAIESIFERKDSDGEKIFDLQGRRLSALQSGQMGIVNGRIIYRK
jgi:hypothetical protein